jgi:hypothetical protein
MRESPKVIPQDLTNIDNRHDATPGCHHLDSLSDRYEAIPPSSARTTYDYIPPGTSMLLRD